jgi:hypothetical protein
MSCRSRHEGDHPAHRVFRSKDSEAVSNVPGSCSPTISMTVPWCDRLKRVRRPGALGDVDA